MKLAVPPMKLAVPSVGEGGLDAQRSAHFSHADCFTILNIENGAVALDGTIANPPHEEGGCMRPVGILADAGIDAIVAVGMGMRPMQGFAAAGITVLHDAESPTVGAAAERVAAGQLRGHGAGARLPPLDGPSRLSRAERTFALGPAFNQRRNLWQATKGRRGPSNAGHLKPGSTETPWATCSHASGNVKIVSMPNARPRSAAKPASPRTATRAKRKRRTL
ncbi:MAG: NifB/NifX family molybdenum-iron cluster-binding protein [Collinsella sp.]